MRYFCPECKLAYHVNVREKYFETCRACRMDELTMDALKGDQPTYERLRRLALSKLKIFEERHKKKYPVADKRLKENDDYTVYLRRKKSTKTS